MSATAEAPVRYRAAAARPGPLGLIREAAVEIWTRRRLIGYLVQADVRKKGSDTLLGNLWWIIDPLLQMAVYVVLVSVIFKRDRPDYPVFIFAAILPWKWFQTTIYDGITSVTGAGGLIRQVQFPKLVLPVASSLAAVWNFAFGLIPLTALIVILFPHRLSPMLLFIPAIALVQLAFNLAMAVTLGALNVFFRDIGNVARHAMRLWFYLSPGLYAFSDLQAATEKLPIPLIRHMILWNPFAILFTAYRNVIYGQEQPPFGGIMPDWGALGALLLASLVLLAFGVLVFKRAEPAFAKVL